MRLPFNGIRNVLVQRRRARARTYVDETAGHGGNFGRGASNRTAAPTLLRHGQQLRARLESRARLWSRARPGRGLEQAARQPRYVSAQSTEQRAFRCERHLFRRGRTRQKGARDHRGARARRAVALSTKPQVGTLSQLLPTARYCFTLFFYFLHSFIFYFLAILEKSLLTNSAN